MPAYETLGIRCSEISQRHRLYGPDVPACDLDFVLIEYDRAEPVALFEHKFYRGGPKLDLNQPSLKAFTSLASRANLPAFVAQYNVDTWMFRVYPANPQAVEFLPRTRWLTEREYATLLYQLRNKAIPATLLMSLNGDPFEDDGEHSQPSVHSPAEVDRSVTALTTRPEEPWDEWDWDIYVSGDHLLCSA